jgi:hypothetical protein
VSHRICNKNLERDSRRVLIAELTAAGFASEVGLYEERIKELQAELLARTNVIASQCPMCRRVYHAGDALCHCAPAMVKSLRVPGEKRLKDYKCLMRVNDALINRHGIRDAMCATKRLNRKHMALLHRTANVLKYEGQIPKGAKERD